ncbi:carboxypeptidase regulatory-like domain-containing protein [Chryseobacterium capnotolerans]|uniref:carboxypeptidase-like regulatory domain-containing protein n=1 Tax=Chryseobacterium TaxID=59732 RepID=UPI00083BA405|nr:MULTISPECIES: carboxypeptidase-like regulatory domain-containing protein [Chryseobacterium]UHO39881.1 carboxypeptidase regulatory-like domain-containing protein [Chryseobacterium capnotolerans]
MKHSFLLFILIFNFYSAQKLQVVDAENGKPIPNARILLHNQIVYTNEEGFAPVDQSSVDFEVSASGFQKASIQKLYSPIKLKRGYKSIDEVKLTKVDLKKIFEDVARNYKKRYYNEPSLYDVTFKEKKVDNHQIHFLVIAETKLWSKTNFYNPNKSFDNNLQMQLNNVKYFKDLKSDSIFVNEIQKFSPEYMGNYFFNFELNRALTHVKNEESKYSGWMIFEQGDEQLITFTIKSGLGIDMEGEMKYNKTDKVITYFEIHYLQDQYPMVKRKIGNGEEYDYQLGNAILVFDFYKNEGVYVPAMSRIEGNKYIAYYKGVKHERKISRELIYNTFKKSDKNGLTPRVDFNKNIWDNTSVKEDKNNSILLTTEEQAFINRSLPDFGSK